MDPEDIKKYILCCACRGSLEESEHINGITLDKLATWKHPTWSNILTLDKYPEPRASAIVCDRCVAEKRDPEFAVEWNEDFSVVKYHPVKDLKVLPKILQVDIEAAARRIAEQDVLMRELMR